LILAAARLHAAVRFESPDRKRLEQLCRCHPLGFNERAQLSDNDPQQEDEGGR
jgi:hypothetical protein